MSDYVPADGTLDVSPEVHDFMNSLEYNPKISEGTKLLVQRAKEERHLPVWLCYRLLQET